MKPVGGGSCVINIEQEIELEVEIRRYCSYKQGVPISNCIYLTNIFCGFIGVALLWLNPNYIFVIQNKG